MRRIEIWISFVQRIPHLLCLTAGFHVVMGQSTDPQSDKLDSVFRLHQLVRPHVSSVGTFRAIDLQFPYRAPENTISAKRHPLRIFPCLRCLAIAVAINSLHTFLYAIASCTCRSSELACIHDRQQRLQLAPVPSSLPVCLSPCGRGLWQHLCREKQF